MPDQDLSWKDAIKMVLIDAVDPMHYTDIADQIIERGLRTEVGATPAATVSSTITVSINSEQERSPFIRISRGYYALRDTDGSTPIEQVGAEEADFIQQEETGFINAFGMYWARDKVLWASATPKLLGRQNPKSTVVDFANQKGVYLLHDRRYVVYVGRATEQTLVSRLKDHTHDRLEGRWDRFSWFGVYPVRDDGNLSDENTNEYRQPVYERNILIVTMEALLIEGLEPPQNRKRGDDFRGIEFIQEEDPDIRRRQLSQLVDEMKMKINSM